MQKAKFAYGKPSPFDFRCTLYAANVVGRTTDVRSFVLGSESADGMCNLSSSLSGAAIIGSSNLSDKFDQCTLHSNCKFTPAMCTSTRPIKLHTNVHATDAIEREQERIFG